MFYFVDILHHHLQILSSPSALRKSHKKLLCLVISILSSTFCMSIAAFYSNFANNWSIFGFMFAEVGR